MKTINLAEDPATLAVNSSAKSTIRLLILEQTAADAELLLAELRSSGFEPLYVLAKTRQEFCDALKNASFDAVLSAYHVTGWSGLEAFLEFRTIDSGAPFLLITGAIGEEAAVKCIKLGVSDYVLKDHLARLPVALRAALAEKTMRDENTRAHEALRLSEARNRDLIDNSIFGICRVDLSGTFFDVNPALVRILGCPAVTALDNLNFARDVFRFPEQYGEFVAACREPGQLRTGEAEWRRCDGGIITVRLCLRRLPHSDSHGDIEVFVEDITELRALEQQLRHAQKFEAIGQLAGGIAHDFNNVIGAILGWAELGYDQFQSDPKVALRFSQIQDEAKRAACLTRELLAFARRQVLRPTPVDLNTVTSNLLSFLDKVIPKNIEMKVLSAPLSPVKADPTQMEQVLMNLCLNARDAMPEGGRLVVETEMVDLDEAYCRFFSGVIPGRYAVLSVSDTGAGMNAETRERIFEPFFTTKGLNKGTGMGLATVDGIVKQHNGFIHVYSELAHGSLFRMYIPVLDGPVARALPSQVAASSFASMRGSEVILLADDHDSIRQMARQTLMLLGYVVLAACDGEEALHLCETQTPALAILDVVMPKMGGPATASRLLERFEKLPVIFTSGYTQLSTQSDLAAFDARYLQKPYSPSVLGRMVREMLDAKKAADAAKTAVPPEHQDAGEEPEHTQRKLFPASR